MKYVSWLMYEIAIQWDPYWSHLYPPGRHLDCLSIVISAMSYIFIIFTLLWPPEPSEYFIKYRLIIFPDFLAISIKCSFLSSLLIVSLNKNFLSPLFLRSWKIRIIYSELEVHITECVHVRMCVGARACACVYVWYIVHIQMVVILNTNGCNTKYEFVWIKIMIMTVKLLIVIVTKETLKW